MLIVVQDAPSIASAVEVAVSACHDDADAVLVVGLPYDAEGAVFAAEHLLALRHLARLDPAARHLHPRSHPARDDGRACFWHLSDLWPTGDAGAVPGGPGRGVREDVGVLGPWADVVCLPRSLAAMAPQHTR